MIVQFSNNKISVTHGEFEKINIAFILKLEHVMFDIKATLPTAEINA